jgi:four helix bundle protein
LEQWELLLRHTPIQPSCVRDHHKLHAFHAADKLVSAVYHAARSFPSYERFGLAMQVRRSSVSIAANIVEGCARASAAEYARHLSIAYGSACEAQYQIDLAIRFGYVRDADAKPLQELAARVVQLLGALNRAVQRFTAGPS